MDGVCYFWWLTGQAFAVTIGFRPLVALTLAGVIGALVTLGAMRPDQWRRTLAGALIPLVIPAAILLCGVLLANSTELDEIAPRWPEWLIGALLLAHLPLAVVLVTLLRGARWFVLAVSVAIFGYSCGAAFMSMMSVSGRWL
jgi:hypothetical protein